MKNEVKFVKKYAQIPLDYLEPLFLEWKKAFDLGEIVNVYFFPNGDLLFRAMQFADWCQSAYGTDCKLLHMETELIIRPDNLLAVLDQKENDDLKILIAKRQFFCPDGNALAQAVEQAYVQTGKGLLILNEGFPLEMDSFFKVPVMNQRRLIWPIYPHEVSLRYIHAMAELWSISVSADQVHQIAEYCGGFPWLVNDVLRRVSVGGELFNDSGFWWKVEKIWSSIPSDYQQTLQATDHIEDPRWLEFQSIGLVDDDKIIWPFLQDWLVKIKSDKLQIDPSKVVLNNTDLTTAFSAGERRILALLRDAKGAIVSREQLGKAFWLEETDANYSDWALDQLVSRLRKKCLKLGIPLTITTRRGRGYECR